MSKFSELPDFTIKPGVVGPFPGKSQHAVSSPYQLTFLYTEQNIRGLAINFLRQHYKLRPRLGTSGTRVVTKVHYYQGVTIDARLSYQKPDGSWFMATVEATSLDRAHEVLYRVNWFRITVHALLLTLVVGLIVLAGAQVRGESVFAWFGRPQVYVFLLTGFITTWVTAGAILSRLKYYRFIYAVAQFMRFHADAQWIAYDRRIFFDSLETADQAPETRRHYRRMRRYYNELQRQCIRFGFGLMEIRENNEVVWLVEPSHIDQFDGQRGRLPQWVRAIQAPPAVARLGQSLPFGKNTAPAAAPQPTVVEPDVADPLAVGNYLPRAMRAVDYQETIIPVAGKPKPWYLQPARTSKRIRWRIRRAYQSLFPAEIRNRPTYYELPWSIVVAGFAMALTCSWLLAQHANWDVIATNSDPDAAPTLQPLEPAASPARSDAKPGVLPGEYDHELTAAEFAAANERTFNQPLVVDSEIGTRRQATVLTISPAHRATPFYDCLPLFLAEGTLFLLEEGRYPDYTAAVSRAELINDTYEIEVAVAARTCLDPLATNYLLYVGGVQATAASANLTLRRLRDDTGLSLEVIEVK